MGALRLAAVALLAVACGGAHTPSPAPMALQGGAPAPTATVVRDPGPPVAVGTDAGVAEAPRDGGEAGGASGEARRLYQEGTEAYGRGDLQAAARAFAAAYALHPAPELAFNAGRMYERLAMVPEAARYYGLVLAATTDPARRADLDARLASLRDYDRRRREDFAQPPPGTDALAREAATWFVRGVALYRRHQYVPALRAFEAAHQYTDAPELLFNLAVTHEHLGNARDAVDAFRAYLQQRPDAPDRDAIERRLRALQSGGS